MSEDIENFEKCVFADENSKNASQIRNVTLAGLAGNILLSALKIVFGITASSQALIADAVHSLSDITTDLAVLFGVKYWTAPPDDSHPYGHWRIEAMVSVIIGLILAVGAVGLGYEALFSFRDEHQAAPPGAWALAAALISIVCKEILYQWTNRVGKRLRSSALKANAWHHRSDALSSIPVAVAIAVAMIFPKWAFVDHLGAFVVSIFILYASWKILKPALFELSDGGVDEKHLKEIEKIAMSVENIKSVHKIRTRRVGPGIYVDMHVLVPGDFSVKHGHDLATAVKYRLIDDGPEVIDVVVHLEPFEEETK